MNPPTPKNDHDRALQLFLAHRLSEAQSLLVPLTRSFPNDPAVWNTLGVILVAAGEVEQAIDAFQAALALGAPAVAGSNLLFAVHTVADIGPAPAFRCVKDCAGRIIEGVRPKRYAAQPVSGRPLRVGYLWAFDLSSTRFFTRSVLVNHDPAAVSLYGYVSSPGIEEVQQTFGRYFAGLRSVFRVDDNATAAMIEQDHLDLLVDLCGHTHRQRLRVLARRVAPVQATWIESFFSTGVPAVDYLITDPLHTPPLGPQGFTELPFRLPRIRLCYAPPDYAPPVGPLPALKNGHVTFGSFNHLNKLNRDVVFHWAAILREVPSARLILKWRSLEDAGVRQRVVQRFAEQGVAAERLELRGHVEHAAMMAEYNEIDLALDPFPYNGGLTTCEALWMGVPVLAVRGDQIISRQTAAISETVGVEDFVADNLEEYRRLAVCWSRDLERLARVRAGLREAVARSPLCDAAGCTRDLEEAYRLMAGVR
jgi:predicted O-linked N-acetylglucosamine transferase (SPINDLY family)